MPRAVRTAVEVAGRDLGAVRIDSGDLPVLARQVRALLDELGATRTRIVLTGDLDEYSIAALGAVPVDGYGVGTSLVTGSGAPTAALVYKLVARASSADEGDDEMEPVAKRSVGKPGRGGRKWAVRHRDQHGTALSERISLSPPEAGPLDRELLVPLVADGQIIGPSGAERGRRGGGGPGAAPRGAGRAAALRAAAVPRLPRHPDHLRARRGGDLAARASGLREPHRRWTDPLSPLSIKPIDIIGN